MPKRKQLCSAPDDEGHQKKCKPDNMRVCPVCLEVEVDSPDSPTQLKFLECKHFLCRECYDTITQMKEEKPFLCPLCRGEVVNNPKTQLYHRKKLVTQKELMIELVAKQASMEVQLLDLNTEEIEHILNLQQYSERVVESLCHNTEQASYDRSPFRQAFFQLFHNYAQSIIMKNFLEDIKFMRQQLEQNIKWHESKLLPHNDV